jgi:putative hemolysin
MITEAFDPSLVETRSAPHGPAAPSATELAVSIATDSDGLRAAQRLRHEVFAREMGALLRCDLPGHDTDPYDAFCAHVIVRNRARDGMVVATTRVLTHEQSGRAGGFYSAGEFDLAPLLGRGLRLVEIGRTCVHADYRSGAAIAMLWHGLARLVDLARHDLLIGCASIPMHDGGRGALAAWRRLSEAYLIEPGLRVTPRLALPKCEAGDAEPIVPALIKAYVRLGAKVCGEPCWDPAFNTADLLVALRPGELNRRYARHFFGR